MLWQPGPASEVQARGLELVSYISAERLRIGSLLGVPAFFLQSLGVLGLYLCTRRSRTTQYALSIIVACLFGVALFAGLAWHISYPALGAAFTTGGIPVSAREELIAHLVRLLSDFYLVSVYAFAAASVALAVLVVCGWTDFPRWFALASPLLLQIALETLSAVLPAPIAVGLYVSSLNFALLVFFMIAVLSLRLHSAQDVEQGAR